MSQPSVAPRAIEDARQLYHDACARRGVVGLRADFLAVLTEAQAELRAAMGEQAVKPLVVGRGRGGNYRNLKPCPRCGTGMNARADVCWRCRRNDVRAAAKRPCPDCGDRPVPKDCERCERCEECAAKRRKASRQRKQAKWKAKQQQPTTTP